jgi:oxygen-independent coproporphyrinogen III oxidase
MTDAELIARYDGRVPRYTSYPTAPNFQAGFPAATYAEWLAALPDDAALSLYFHVPFCDRLCLYCGCNTTVVRLDAPRRAYADLLIAELEMTARQIGRRARVSHVHWGGGTPTTLPADCLIAAMAAARRLFAFDDVAEVAIEIDPTSLDKGRLAALREMGVNRASLGVQDLEEAVQEAIGRRQSYEITLQCADDLRGLGISSINLDLIYGLPLQTEESVARTAEKALGLAPDRIAVFGYAHVPWMKKHQALIKEETLPGPLARFRQRAAIERVLLDAGYVAIGLDHYARPDDAMAKAAAAEELHRSFQGYTTDGAPVLIGIGASSIGTLPQGYVQNQPGVPAYSQAIKSGQFATTRGIAVSPADALRRAVIEQIMCHLSVDLERVAAGFSASVVPLVADAQALARFEADGLVTVDNCRIAVTEIGRPFVRNVAAVFDAYIAMPSDTPRHAAAV